MRIPNENAEAFIQILASALTRTLGEDLVAIYLYGSYVSGGYDPGVSDLDLIAVTRIKADDLDLAKIGAMHDGLVAAHPEWDDRVEVVYISEQAVRQFRTSTERLAVISPGEPLHLRTERPVEWLQNFYLARTTGRVLFGPPPDTLIPTIAWSEFVDASRRYARQLAAQDLDGARADLLAYSVLTLCRIEHAVEADSPATKEAAAIEAKERHPEFAWIIDEALRCRLARGSTGFDDDRSRSAATEFVRRVVEHLGLTHGETLPG
jgi:predicted nucleotidyltransferase